MSIMISGERFGDEADIDNVNSQAFASMSEANIVRLTRQYYPAFDRRYSVIAREGEAIIGHALFTPARIRLLGQTVPALAVGPVAVAPHRQRQGVGGMLLRYGHALGQQEGYVLAFLCGIPAYYPRHGYQPCFGFSELRIDTGQLPAPARRFSILPVQSADLPWLVERLAAEMAEVDFAWLWGMNVSEWSIPAVNAMIWWTEEGRRAAYTVAPHGRGRCELLLADDPELACDVLATLRPAMLKNHPAGWLARDVLSASWATPAIHAGAPAWPVHCSQAPCSRAWTRKPVGACRVRSFFRCRLWRVERNHY